MSEVNELLLEEAKRCTLCGELKPISSFSLDNAKKHKFRAWCQDCSKIRHREWYNRNLEERKIYREKRKALNPYQVWAENSLLAHKANGYTVLIRSKDLAEVARGVKYCGICGNELEWNRGDKKIKMSSLPTLDRKYNGKRLTLANTWILCHRCNSMKHDAPLPELIEWCRNVVEKFGGDYR